MSFLNQLRQDTVDFATPTISCQSTADLNLVIAKLKATRIHRIFVADDATGYVPLKVVSLTDILRFIVKHG